MESVRRRKCGTCKRYRELQHFYKHGGKPYGPCIDCKTSGNKTRRAASRERVTQMEQELTQLREQVLAATAFIAPTQAHATSR